MKNGVFRDTLRPCRFRILLLSVLTVVQSVLQVLMALLSRFVVDSAIAGDGKLGLYAALLGADLLLQLIAYLLLNWYSGSTADRLVANLRSRLLHSALYSRESSLQGYHSGALLSRGIEDVNTVCDGAVYALPSLIGQLTRLVAAFAAIFFISPTIAIVLLLGGIGLVVYMSLLRPALRKHHRNVRESDETVMATMQEDLQKLELIQSMQTQEQSLHRFDRQLTLGLRKKFHRRLLSVGAFGIINGAILICSGLILLWGASRVGAGLLTFGSLTSMLQLLGQFRGPLMGVSGLWSRFSSVEVAGERLAVMLEIPEQPERKDVERPTAVVFENVTFSYPDDEQPVLQDFSLRLPLDRWTSLGGISGRGKTTLFKLILGLYTPQKGRVYLETEKGEIPCSPAVRHLFAYVPQDYALFSGTVLENLLLVAPDAEPQQRKAALTAACADFVFSLTDGENTRVGENNTGLSKGQLQRLAIARAILMDRKVLLLDECTSALDAETEQAVLKNLYAFGGGALLVTHRPGALSALPDVNSIQMEN